ncbi:MAG: DUF4157 domain-containing protein, partial [Bacteroidota bacterium]
MEKQRARQNPQHQNNSPSLDSAFEAEGGHTMAPPPFQLFADGGDDNSPPNAPPADTPDAPTKENITGMPDDLKAGVENLSGYSMDDVKVHYNSDKPAQLQAHAYAQGTDIHIGPGQEKHLPHEAWHVVQQKQGRVRPTVQFKGGVNVNDDAGLEKEADVMGPKAVEGQASSMQIGTQKGNQQISHPVRQRVAIGNFDTNNPDQRENCLGIYTEYGPDTLMELYRNIQNNDAEGNTKAWHLTNIERLIGGNMFDQITFL